MFLDWRERCETAEDPKAPIAPLMVLSCAAAFGIDRRDLLADIRDKAVGMPRIYAMVMLRRIGFNRNMIALLFNKNSQTLYQRELTLWHELEWIDGENLGDCRPTPSGKDKGRVPLRLSGKARQARGKDEARCDLDSGRSDGGEGPAPRCTGQ